MPSMSQSFPSPEWVICGMTLSDGRARIIASKSMTRAELEARFEHQDVYGGLFAPVSLIPDARIMTSHDYILTSHMRDLVIIDAVDYAAAFKALFEKWSPDQVKRPAIGRGQAQLES